MYKKKGGEVKHYLEARSPIPVSSDISDENDQSEELQGIIHQGQTLSQNKLLNIDENSGDIQEIGIEH